MNPVKRERRFELNGLTIAAQEWGSPGAPAVMALHGWLDNSASFERLVPFLNHIHLVALDLAGHGQSDHRPGVGPYNIWEDVPEIFEVADQLGWPSFTLMGHSRGGIIGMLAAGTFPTRIERLVLIEALWPEVHISEQAPGQLRRSIEGLDALQHKRVPVYQDLALAIRARERGMFPLGHEAARLLTERGVRSIEGGYTWSTDQRLLAPSAVKLTEPVITAFLKEASAPMAMILGKEGIPSLFGHYRDALQCFPAGLQTLQLPGGHHLHLESQAECVANAINRFLAYDVIC